MNMTSRFQRCIDAAITTSMIYCEVNLLSNVMATFDIHCKFDPVVSSCEGVVNLMS